MTRLSIGSQTCVAVLDYLKTRNDIDSKKIAFFGPSSGSRTGLNLAAVDRRYGSVFLAVTGIRKRYARIAEANTVNFAPHIRGPILMLQGRYDETLPWKTEAEPLYKLLSEPRRLILFDRFPHDSTSIISIASES